MKLNIMQTVVDQGGCIGCGVCAAICPAGVLSIGFNGAGLYQPYESVGCIDKCTLCLDVCPFFQRNSTELELAKATYSHVNSMRYHNEIGYFIATYAMYKQYEPDRLKSASGGAGHWLLSVLLEKRLVDWVVTVEPNSDPERLFRFAVFGHADNLDNTRGSVYYPTELSEVLTYIMNNDGCYAITALPCYAKAIRLAQQRNKELRSRIRYIIGLVCGQMKSKEFTKELGRIATGADRISKVRYRVKQPKQPANNFAFEFETMDGLIRRLDFTAGPSKCWSNRMFTPLACNNCRDTFAHCADVVLMDAWLPEYTRDYRGHSLAVLRSRELDDLVTSSDDLSVKKVPPQCLYDSQRNVVRNKKALVRGSINPITQRITFLKRQIQTLTSYNYWRLHCGKIETYVKQIENLEKINRTIAFPGRASRKLIKKLKGKLNEKNCDLADTKCK